MTFPGRGSGGHEKPTGASDEEDVPFVRRGRNYAPPPSGGRSSHPTRRTARWPMIAVAAGALVVGGTLTSILATDTGSGEVVAAVPAGTDDTSAPGSDAARPSWGGLVGEAQSDTAAAESLIGSWVPQLAMQRADTSDSNEIYRRYLRESQRGTVVLLVRSEEFTNFRPGPYWVLIAYAPFSSAAEVKNWCASNGLAAQGCVPVLLSRS